MWPNFLCALLINIFPEAVFAISALPEGFDAMILYSPLLWGMVAMVQLVGVLIVHISLEKVVKYPALLSLLMDINVKAISGECIIFEYHLCFL